jgi:hypothetical protein
MSSEIENLVASFRAVVADEINRHRGDGQGYPDNFAKAVIEHKERYSRKLDGMRQHANDSLRSMIETAEASIASIADAEIERVRASGNVDFAA